MPTQTNNFEPSQKMVSSALQGIQSYQIQLNESTVEGGALWGSADQTMGTLWLQPTKINESNVW
jgi:hypothetical protein